MLKRFLILFLAVILMFSELPCGVLKAQAQTISDEETTEMESEDLLEETVEEEPLELPEEKIEEEQSETPEEDSEDDSELPEKEVIEEEPILPEEEQPVVSEEELTEEEAKLPEEEVIEEESILPEEEFIEEQPVMPEDTLSVEMGIVEKEATFNYGAEIGEITLQIDSVDDSSIRLSWSVPEGVHGYELYRSVEGSEYENIATIEVPDIDNYHDTNLILGKTYSYRIVPYMIVEEEFYYSESYAEASAKTFLAGATLNSITSINYKTLKVNWKTIKGADGYEVYRADAKSGEYKRVKAFTSGSTSEFQNTLLKPNKWYYYKVRAYKLVDGEKIYGDFSAVKGGKAMFTKVTGLKATLPNYKTIKLSWNKVSGAAKYQVYYSTSKDSGYKLLKTTTGTSFLWEKPVCGNTYYFKVRAIKIVSGTNVYGDYSAIVAKKAVIGKTTVSAVKKNYQSISVSWKKVNGAQNYQLYFSTSQNGTYKLLKTTTGTAYVHTGRTLGTTYYYKVRTIRQNSKSDSAIISAKTSLGRISGLDAEKISEGYKLSWKAADGVSSYKIYRSTEKYGTYKLIGTTTSTSYKDKKAGKETFYYKVQGCRNTFTTAFAGPIMASVKRIGLGIDVSEYQGKIDWKAVEDDGVKFAMLRIVKGTVNNMTADARFEENFKGARAAGLSVGVYRYCYATTTSQAKKEANKVLEILNGRELEYPIVLDMEDSSLLHLSNSQRSKIVLAFKEVIEDAGYDFAMYANLNWVNNYLDMNKLEDVDLWLARWRPRVLGAGYEGDNDLVMWQYSSTGTVDGISGNVDMNVSYK